jgi:hypothetical protein
MESSCENLSWRHHEELSGKFVGEGSWVTYTSDRTETVISIEEKGFDAQHLHAVQVGLGTFATVMQNLVGSRDEWDPMIGWLLESTSEWRPEYFRAVALEPVAEHVSRLRRDLSSTMPSVALLQVALGEHVALEEVYVFTEDAYTVAVAAVPNDQQEEVGKQLTYLRNMSCVGSPHPDFLRIRGELWYKFGIDVMMEAKHTHVWTYQQLVRNLNFKGVELLIIDAEGYDTMILRSVIDHCRTQEADGSWEWPDVIVYETLGHCDRKVGMGTEAACMEMLREWRYSVLTLGGPNVTLVNNSAFRYHEPLRAWIAKLHCKDCAYTDFWPFTMGTDGEMRCSWCFSQLKSHGSSSDNHTSA